ncbi:hypothetical protein [Pseudoxanthomonas sp. UC19_8]|uniref:hypothetical protein n=1 Tax=Pseudoxanthomonas sp. UC19_8 TaxID=3350175 RepID=UPI0036D20AE1
MALSAIWQAAVSVALGIFGDLAEGQRPCRAELAPLEHSRRSDRRAAEQAPLYRGFEFFCAMSRDVLIACDRSMIGAFGDLAGSDICPAGHLR